MKITGIEPASLLIPPERMETIKTPSFADWLTERVQDTNSKVMHADQSLEALASGKTQNLHETMIILEEAKLSFQYLEQIRNRCIQAFQELLREQI